MKAFVAQISTADRRLTKQKVYHGFLIAFPTRARSGSKRRVVIKDDLGEHMTFDPAAFVEFKL